MGQDHAPKKEYGLWIDIPFILRSVRQWLLPSLFVGIFMALVVYIGGNEFLSGTYTATATVAVVSRNNDAGNLADYNNGNAVTRNVNMWNSNSLLKAIQDANPEHPIQGGLGAEAVEGASLVKVYASSNSAEEAYFLLSAALRNYRKISKNFDTSYYTVVMTKPSRDCISFYKKNILLFTILAFIGAFGGCIGLVCLWAMVTDVLHSEEQAEQLVAVPVYGVLARVRKKGKKALLVSEDNLSMRYLEQLNKLASRVVTHMQYYKHQILMVTSVEENDGKTTASANLALELARRGYKTLLMDMDFRRPKLATCFEQERGEKMNLSQLLKTKGDLLEQVDAHPELYGLHILWQFDSISSSDQMLENCELRAQLETIAKEYDWIIIDTPPMAPVRDGEVIAKAADDSLLIALQNHSHAAVINDVSDLLEESGAPCCGVVLNRFKGRYRRTRKNYGYHYQYSMNHANEIKEGGTN